MQRKPATLKRSTLRAVSPKRVELQKQYLALRKRKLEETPICEFQGCTRKACDLHHKASRGRHFLTYEFFMSVCRPHHDWIEQNRREAETLGYVIRDRSPYDPFQQNQP